MRLLVQRVYAGHLSHELNLMRLRQFSLKPSRCPPPRNDGAEWLWMDAPQVWHDVLGEPHGCVLVGEIAEGAHEKQCGKGS